MEDYLTRKGINARAPFRCLSPAHADEHPSMSLDLRRNKCHCFACGADYDIFAVIGIDYGLERFSDQYEKACELFGLQKRAAGERPRALGVTPKAPPQAQQSPASPAVGAKPVDIGPYLGACAARAGMTDYFQRRGLSAATVERFHLGYDPGFQTRQSDGFAVWQAAVIPTGENSCTLRNVNSHGKDDRIRKRGASPVFNLAALDGDEPVFVTEGEFDALSLCELGASAVALGSTSNADLLLRRVLRDKPKAPLILCLDNDAEGKRASDKIAAALADAGIPCLEADICGAHKDPNEALVADRAGLLDAVTDALEQAWAQQDVKRRALEEEYLQNSAYGHISAFMDGIAQSANTAAIPTGFVKLDRQLDGGLYEGLVVVGAISSLGKTTLALQMADQIAAEGADALIFSLEMARFELMAKSLSRLTLALCLESGQPTDLAKTARGITSGKRYLHYSRAEDELISAAIKAYEAFARRVFIHEGSGEVGARELRRTIERHIAVTGRTPVVFVDYLQLLSPADPRATDKQNIDRAVLELKRISRDFKTPVIAISSFNRQSYRDAVSMEAFKESGAIEYSSDVLIGLQVKGAGAPSFDVNEAKQRDPREIELKILKNRNGPTGGSVNFEYYPMFNFFKEAWEKDDPPRGRR